MTENIVGDRYVLGPVLGRGGMAEVRRGRDTRLERDVAIKRLRADLAGDAIFQERFRREAHAAAGLNHPNIVAVYDTGEEIDKDSGVRIPYIVMELVTGHTLREILNEGRKILPVRALEITRAVLEALDYSHRHGIVHRDIKPANVMVTNSGQVKVMDFGIARAVADTQASMTQTASVIGTPQYLSPEQIRGETVDRRSDIYAVGCLLFELLAGRPPFEGDSPVALAYQHVRKIPEPPSSIDPMISADMDAIVLKALAKDPVNRYQTARDMADDIGRLLDGQHVTAVVPVNRAEFTDPQATSVIVPPSPVNPAVEVTGNTVVTRGLPARAIGYIDEEAEKSRKGLLAGFITVLVVLLLLAGLFFGWRWWQGKNATPAVESPHLYPVPKVVTMPQQAAEDTLREAKFVPKVVPYVGANDGTVGQVTNQDPAANTPAQEGSEVTIEVNLGPDTQEIPSGLVGQDKDWVVNQLHDLKFTNVQEVPAEQEGPNDVANTVLSTTPKYGARIPTSDPITVYYATGTAAIPNLRGETRDEAIATLARLGFLVTPQVITQPSDDTPGTVIDQDPRGGTDQKYPKATLKVTLYVAEPRATTPPPPLQTYEPTHGPTEPPTSAVTISPTTAPPTTEPPTETPSATPGGQTTAPTQEGVGG